MFNTFVCFASSASAWSNKNVFNYAWHLNFISIITSFRRNVRSTYYAVKNAVLDAKIVTLHLHPAAVVTRSNVFSSHGAECARRLPTRYLTFIARGDPTKNVHRVVYFYGPDPWHENIIVVS